MRRKALRHDVKQAQCSGGKDHKLLEPEIGIGNSKKRRDQPFTPPAVMPSIKYRWKLINRIRIGIIAITEPAISTA